MTFYLALRYINRPENKHDFSSIALLSPCNSVGGGYSNEAVLVWLGEWVRARIRLALPCGHDRLQFLPDHFQTSHVSCS